MINIAMDKGIVKSELAIPMLFTIIILTGETMVITKHTKDVKNEIVSRITSSASTQERIASILERISVILSEKKIFIYFSPFYLSNFEQILKIKVLFI